MPIASSLATFGAQPDRRRCGRVASRALASFRLPSLSRSRRTCPGRTRIGAGRSQGAVRRCGAVAVGRAGAFPHGEIGSAVTKAIQPLLQVRVESHVCHVGAGRNGKAAHTAMRWDRVTSPVAHGCARTAIAARATCITVADKQHSTGLYHRAAPRFVVLGRHTATTSRVP